MKTRSFKARLCLFGLAIGCFSVVGAQVPPPRANLQAIFQVIEDSEYEISGAPESGTLRCPNRKQNLRFIMEGARLRVTPREVADSANPWIVDLNLVSVDRGEGDRLGALTACRKANQQAVFTIEDIEIQYENSNRGLKQSFLVAARPPGAGMLHLRLDLSSEGIRVNARRVDETAVALIDPQGLEIIEYGELLVLDAKGIPVPAHFEIVAADTISIVVDDRTAPYPLLVDPLVFNKSYDESQSGAQFGFSVSGIGTTKAPPPGGGIIVGAPYYDDGTNANVGKVFAFEAPQSTLPASATWTKLGNQAGACFGFSVADAGDVDDDGYDDVIIGSPYYDYYGNSRGKAEIFAGSSSGLSSSAYWTAYGEGDGACFGWSVAGGKSIGNDTSFDDVLVGAPWTSVGEVDRVNLGLSTDSATGVVGAAYLFLGRDAQAPSTTPSWTTYGDTEGDYYGYVVAFADDVNNDEKTDVVVGAPNAFYSSSRNGAVYLFHSGSTLPASTPTVIRRGSQTGSFFGASVAACDSFGGDSYDDLVVGAPYYSNGQSGEGAVFAYEGSSSGYLSSPSWSAEGAQAGAHFGWAVACGDITDDGICHIFVGAPDWDLNGQTSDVGLVVLFVGQFDDDPVYESPSIAGVQAGEHEGASVAFADTVEYLHPGFVTGRPGPSSPTGAGGSVSVWLYDAPE